MWGIRKGWWGPPPGRPGLPCAHTPAPHPQSRAAQSPCRSWLRRPRTQQQPPPQLAGPCGPGAGERQGGKENQEEPRLTSTPTPPRPGPHSTWASVPSRIVAAGSGVEAASSSHRGVQMFPGEMLGWGRTGGQGSPMHTLPLGLTPPRGSPPTWSCSPVDTDAILTLIQGQGFGQGCHCPLQKTGHGESSDRRR